MKLRNLPKLMLAGLFAATIIGCAATFQCGKWTFSGTPVGNTFPLSSAFSFDPSSCRASCNDSQDVMVQMTWVYDADTHTNLYASDQPQGARSTADGWSIDRINGAAHGYYGLQNNGMFYPGWNTPGSNGTANTLFDEPGGWGPDTWFYAVDVAVTYDSKSCNDRILGYYFWSYVMNSNDVGQTFITAPAWKDLDSEFRSALTAWNNWSPTSGSESDGTGTFDHAIAFPSLANL
jgi:hypothetical protein